MKGEEILIVIALCIFFVLLSLGAVFLSLATINRVKKIKEYCNERFNKIEELIRVENENKKSVSELISQLNTIIKNKTP